MNLKSNGFILYRGRRSFQLSRLQRTFLEHLEHFLQLKYKPFYDLTISQSYAEMFWDRYDSIELVFLLMEISVWTDLTGAKDTVHLPFSLSGCDGGPSVCCQSVSRAVILSVSVSLWACNSSIKVVLL